MNHKTIVNHVMKLLVEQSNFYEEDKGLESINSIHETKILKCIETNSKIVFTLPAFPAKSGNREKTYSNLPDVAELQALKSLNVLASKINDLTQCETEIIICSDGRVFSDLVGITEEDVSLYSNKLVEIRDKFEFTHLSFFNLEDIYTNESSYDEMRQKIEDSFAKSLEEVRSMTKTNDSLKQLFNGIHRFMKEDYLVLYQDLSKTKVLKLAKSAAYRVIQRSDAWGSAVQSIFPTSIRLSIHPQSVTSEKFPVKLVPGEGNWGTPWHRVALVENGQITLVRHGDAIHAGATLKRYKEEFAYFEKDITS